jgi:heme oxygenase
MTSPLLTALRDATAPHHRRLELRIPLTDPDLSLSDYAATLRAYLGFYTPVEAKLAPLIQPVTELAWDQRRKSHLLAADLQRLNAGASDAPHCTKLPALDSYAAAIGVMYVLEGATLGGRALLKMFGTRLAPSGAIDFLNGYGADTSPRWKQFTDYLWRIAAPADRDTAVTAAVSTFTQFEQWLDDCEVLR